MPIDTVGGAPPARPAGAPPPGAVGRGARGFGRSVGPYLLAVLFVLGIWQSVEAVFHPPGAILPSPAQVARTVARMIASGELFSHAGISLARVLVAWFLSAVAAIPLGVLMAQRRTAERLIDPLIEIFRPISPLAWIPLAILWFGIGEGGKIFIIFIATFFPILLNTVDGVKRVDPVLLRAGRVLGCRSTPELFVRVILPAALPTILVGLRVSFGTGWAAIIAAELVAAKSGLGYLISNGMEILRSDLVVVGMITIGVIGVAVDAIFKLLLARFS